MSIQVDVGAEMDAVAATEGIGNKERPLRGARNVEVETIFGLI